MPEKLIWITGIISALIVATLVAWAGSYGGRELFGIPVMIWCAVVAFAIQWVVFVPSYLFQTEHYFDLTGSLTYIGLSVFLLVNTGFSEPRTLVIALLVIVWATRLGSFLFLRIRGAGEDRRFRKMKTDFLQFLMTWTIQGLWVFITYAAGIAAMTSADAGALDLFAAVGVLVWILGFSLEVIADRQKSRFRADPANRGRFIASGLWAWSRHPNYFGEILLWLGITLIAFPALAGLQYATLISPVFVVVLLTLISGVRMLENRAERAWGDDPAYQAYRDSTPVLIPWPPRTRPA